MADTITMDLISYADIKTAYPFYNNNTLIDKLYKKGKNPQIMHFDVALDTSTANTPTESTKPTNECVNFTTPQQVFIRSSEVADTEKKVDVIGQKADGSFGKFTLTSDDTDGTTPVDVGTWNFIAFPIKNDAWAGNCIIDDDGSSTTIFWTLALGVSGVDGIFYVPEGFKGSPLSRDSSLAVMPTNVNNATGFQVNNGIVLLLNTYMTNLTGFEGKHIAPEKTRIACKTFFKIAVTVSTFHVDFVIWEK